MPKKKNDKKTPILKPEFQNILICKKKEQRPFLEILVEEPENISRKNLGVLVGIFQINDYSEDSSYIVNYLISIIKKEYFSKVNRGSVENFEAALHKANLALAKLASHENIDWIGNLNAICAVIEKNNILISQTGTASAFLLRKTSLIEITESTEEQAEISPLKTFQDVISGKIEKDDKLLFTTKEVFELFSLEEIKRSALKFSRDNFIQFLNTALINELDQVATLVIDIAEQEDLSIMVSAPTKKTPPVNVFSQAAFRKNDSPAKNKKIENTATVINPPHTEDEPREKEEDFIGQKNGHVYMKEDSDFEEEAKPRIPLFDFSQLFEKLALISTALKKFVKNKKISILKSSLALGAYLKTATPKFKNKRERTSDELEALVLDKLREETGVENTTTRASEKTKHTELSKPNILITSRTRVIQLFQDYAPKINKKIAWIWERFIDISIIILRQPVKGFLALKIFAKNAQEKRARAKEATVSLEEKPVEKNIETFFSEEKDPPYSPEKNTKATWLDFLKKIIPDFSRLKVITKKFNSKQKLSAILILFMILVVPYWIAKWQNNLAEEKPVSVVIEAPVVTLPLEKDKNVKRLENLNTLYSGENVQKILNLNNKLFALKADSIINLENQKSISIPEDFKSPDLFFGMRDLNLIFLIKNSQIIALAPTTEKFTPNNLVFPENKKIIDAKTYLTYLYLVDQNENQIYRYPRAEGGFGEKTAWLKEENLNLSSTKNLTINENVFINNNAELIKLFRGKRQPFSIEETATPIVLDKIHTEQGITNLYILDKTNSRIIKLDADGNIISQYYNEKIATANDFSVSEENNLIYISNENGVESFNM